MTALESNEWEVVVGAAEGLALGGNIPVAAVERLGGLLSADDAQLRRASAVGLRMLGDHALAALDALVDRLWREEELVIVQEIVAALGAIGVPAIDPLVDVVRKEDMRKTPLAAASLVLIGNAHPDAVVGALLSYPELSTALALIGIVRELGAKAAIAVPALAELLDGAPDDESAVFVLASIGACGAAGIAAAPAVARCLARHEGTVAEWSYQALWQMGPEALPAVEELLKKTEGPAKERLERLNSAWRPRAVESFEEFAGIDLALIELFVRAATILARGAASWPEVLNELRERGAEDSLVPLNLEIDPKTLSNHVKKLGTKLNVTLTWGRERGKRRLTQEAASVLEKARSYLKALRERSSSGDQAT